MTTAPPDAVGDRAALALALCAALVSAALVAQSLASVRYVENPDEAYYLAYAGFLNEHGPAGFRTLFRDYVGEPERWVYPNPLRVGFFGLASLWTSLRGASFGALSELSLLCHALLVGACFGFLRDVQGRTRALLAAALIGCSPLLLGIARRAWIDAPATLAGLLVLWSLAASISQPQLRLPRLRLAVAFGGAILIKETALLLLLPCAALLAWERFGARRPLSLAAFGLALGVPPLVCAGLWWLAAGDLSTLVGVGRIILESPSSNAYALAYGGGPWSRYLLDLLLLAPGTTLAGLAALGLAARPLRSRVSGDAAVWLCLVLLGILFAHAPFTKNVRYVALVEVPLRALAVALISELCGGSRRGVVLAAALVLLLCALDWASFQRLFVESALYDPMTAPLLFLRGASPHP